MASIKSRIADLERSRNMALRRELSDAERAVRLVHILHRQVSPEQQPLRRYLKSIVDRDAQQIRNLRF